MANRIQLRRDTTANWNSVDPVLADGEPGYDIVTNELRIGNGSNTWSQLSANTISGGGGASTGNVTFSDINVIGTSSLRLQPNVALDESYIDIYLTTGPDAHIDTYSANLILGKDSSANVRLATDGNVQIRAEDGGSTSTWTFDPDGNLRLPAGGTITEANVGLADALILTPANISYSDQQLRIYSTGGMVEGNHLHLTTGNLYATELYLGDDNYFVKLGNTGNVGIRATTQSLSSTALWTFGTDGVLTFPTGNLVITPDDAALGNSAVIASVNNLITLSTGANGGLSSLWVEDYANLNTSNIAAVYANPTPGSKIVRIAVGQNGGGGPNLWDFGTDGNLTIPGNLISFASSPAPFISGFGSADFSGNVTVGNLILPAGGQIQSPAGVGNVTIEANDGNNVRTWTFETNGNITFPDATTQGTAYRRTTGSWTVATGSATYSFTVPQTGTYAMWVRGTCDNGIITWNATATVTNNNVPVIGQQYAWVYSGGGTPIDFTDIPHQFVGTANTIVRSNPSVTSPTNRFDFVINNTSGSEQTVYWGYVAQ